jgi:hypothetical protein
MLKEDAKNLATHYHIRFVLQAMKDYKTYVQVLVNIGYSLALPPATSHTQAEFSIRLLVPGYAIALFSPTIINELGFSAANAQLLSVPPFIAGCIATILVGIMSDKHNLRGPYIIGGAFVSLVGYILLYCNTQAGPSYVGVFLAAAIYSTVAVELAWVISNAGGDLKRGVVIAMVVGFSNLGGWVMLSLNTRYLLKHALVFAPPSFILMHHVTTLGMAQSWHSSVFRMSPQFSEPQYMTGFAT